MNSLVKLFTHVFAIALATLASAAVKPNFIILLADDLGFADVGYHKCQDIPTPNIDAISKSGVQFPNGYSNGNVCTPTRAALLTGRYQNRYGCDYHIAPYRRSPGAPVGLPPDVPTIAELLQPLGYATGIFGKWHLGGELEENQVLMPPSRGFDEFYGILEGAALYFQSQNQERKYRRGYTPIDGEELYLTDAIGREAVSFIRRHKDKPFLLYVPFTAPHAPRQTKPEHLEKFRHIESRKRRELVSMVYSLDENVGKILAAVRQEGLENETLTVFFSDNGGKPNDNGSQNHPLRGEKGQFFEGGIRVPFCIQWPGTIEAGLRFEPPIIGMDLFPTIYQLAGGAIDPNWEIDGVDLMPFMNGKRDKIPHETLFWKSDSDLAVRDKNWKLVKHQGTTYLFDLKEDPYEENNLLSNHPKKADALLEKWAHWDQKNVLPNYGWPLRKTGIHVERIRR